MTVFFRLSGKFPPVILKHRQACCRCDVGLPETDGITSRQLSHGDPMVTTNLMSWLMYINVRRVLKKIRKYWWRSCCFPELSGLIWEFGMVLWKIYPAGGPVGWNVRAGDSSRACSEVAWGPIVISCDMSPAICGWRLWIPAKSHKIILSISFWSLQTPLKSNASKNRALPSPPFTPLVS